MQTPKPKRKRCRYEKPQNLGNLKLHLAKHKSYIVVVNKKMHETLIVEVTKQKYQQHWHLATALFEHALQTKTSKEKMVAKRDEWAKLKPSKVPHLNAE